MRNRHVVVKPVACLMTFVFCYFNVLWAPAHAALVTTAQTMQASENEAVRARLHVLLDRADVRERLERWGVDPAEARARVDTLTAEELDELASRMEQQPAGSGGLAIVAVVLLVAFLIILLTDILGYTNIFTFTR